MEREGRSTSPSLASDNLYEVKSLSKSYESHGSRFGRGVTNSVRAVDDISLTIRRGEILGLAGESGSGKSTVGELLVRLQEPTSGQILFDGENVSHLSSKRLLRFRRRVQMVFQDPYESLHPGFTIYESIVEPLKMHRLGSGDQQHRRVIEALEAAELRPADTFLSRYPHELSGGQRQRVAIARAIAQHPDFIVADEPVSMLDVSVRAGILRLLKRLRDELGLTILYVSHDLSTVTYLTQRLAVLYLGRIVEVGPTRRVSQQPLHPYTVALFAAVPLPYPDSARPEVPIRGELSTSSGLTGGCNFAPRCPKAGAICHSVSPRLREVRTEEHVACHLYHHLDGTVRQEPLRTLEGDDGEPVVESEA